MTKLPKARRSKASSGGGSTTSPQATPQAAPADAAPGRSESLGPSGSGPFSGTGAVTLSNPFAPTPPVVLANPDFAAPISGRTHNPFAPPTPVVLTDTHRWRMDPRLRVFSNGDETVNSMRADVSPCLVSAHKAPAAWDLLHASPHPLSPAAGLPPSRPKLKDQAKAQTAFVNVFLDIRRERVDGEDTTVALAPVTKLLHKHADQAAKAARAALAPVLRKRNQIVATVPVSLLDDLARDDSIGFISAAEPLRFDPPAVTAAAPAPPVRAVDGTAMHQDGAGVLIGIIDVGGFDFAHQDFLGSDGGTRFERIWDMGLTDPGRLPPTRFGYGAEITKRHMDNAIRKARASPGTLPERFEPQSQMMRSSHATHVASIAAGNAGVCRAARIAGVLIDLPSERDDRVRRRSAFSDTSRIVHAVEYLLDLGKDLKLPVSINISLGTNGGAHDGSAAVSRWLDAALGTAGRCICVAAGNAGEATQGPAGIIRSAGPVHASGCLPARGLEVELAWVVQGRDGVADLSENELEIWYGPQDRFTVAVLPPGGSEWIVVKPQQFVENRPLADGTRLSVYNELYHPGSGANCIALYLSPNFDIARPAGVRAGGWRVRLHGDEVRDGRFHAWIERDDIMQLPLPGGAVGYTLPSFFGTGSSVDSHTISSLACGNCVVAVGNLDVARGAIAPSSSNGPTRDERRKPDVAAPGTNIVAADGFAGTADAWIGMTGTSMASPYAAGVIGLMLSANPRLTAAQINGILQRTARPLAGATYEWTKNAGFGAIDPSACVAEAEAFGRRQDLG